MQPHRTPTPSTKLTSTHDRPDIDNQQQPKAPASRRTPNASRPTASDVGYGSSGAAGLRRPNLRNPTPYQRTRAFPLSCSGAEMPQFGAWAGCGRPRQGRARGAGDLACGLLSQVAGLTCHGASAGLAMVWISAVRKTMSGSTIALGSDIAGIADERTSAVRRGFVLAGVVLVATTLTAAALYTYGRQNLAETVAQEAQHGWKEPEHTSRTFSDLLRRFDYIALSVTAVAVVGGVGCLIPL